MRRKYRKYYKKNREKILETRKKYWKKYYKKNKKRHLKNSKEWHIKNREKVRKQGKIRYEQNPEKYRLKSKRWRENNEKNGLCVICSQKKKSKLYCEKCLKKERKRLKILNKIRIKKSFKTGKCIRCRNKKKKSKLYCSNCLQKMKLRGCYIKILAFRIISKEENPKCICGYSDIRGLVIHHEEDIPAEQLKKERDTSSFYLKIINGERKTNDLKIRCFSCNRIAEYEEKGRLFFDKELINELLREKGQAILK